MFRNLENVPQDLGSRDPTFFQVWSYSPYQKHYGLQRV